MLRPSMIEQTTTSLPRAKVQLVTSARTVTDVCGCSSYSYSVSSCLQRDACSFEL